MGAADGDPLGEYHPGRAGGPRPGVAGSRQVLPACVAGGSHPWRECGEPLAGCATAGGPTRREGADRDAVDRESEPQDTERPGKRGKTGLYTDHSCPKQLLAAALLDRGRSPAAWLWRP